MTRHLLVDTSMDASWAELLDSKSLFHGKPSFQRVVMIEYVWVIPPSKLFYRNID